MVLTQNEAKIAFMFCFVELPVEEGIDVIFEHINLDAHTINNLQYSDCNNNNALPTLKQVIRCY
jgi:hypothetical protein